VLFEAGNSIGHSGTGHRRRPGNVLRLLAGEDQAYVALCRVVFGLVDDVFALFGNAFQCRAFCGFGLFAQ